MEGKLRRRHPVGGGPACTLVSGGSSHPRSRGSRCNTGRGLRFAGPRGDLLATPLRRGADGGLDAIGWGTAVAEIASRLREVADRHGGKGIALYGGGGQGKVAQGAVHGLSFHRCEA